MAVAQAAAAREQATGLSAGVGVLAAVVVAGLLYAYWRRRQRSATDAPAKAPSSSVEKGAGGGGGGAAAQSAKFDTLNPYVRGAKERALREHGAGRRVGRTAWDPAQALKAQPATPQGAGAAAGSRGASTARSAALAGSVAVSSLQTPFAQEDEAPVDVSVWEEGEDGAQSEDPQQGGAQRGALPGAAPPPAALAVRSPLGRAPSAGVSAARSPLRALLGSPFGAVSLPFSSLPMPTPPARGGWPGSR